MQAPAPADLRALLLDLAGAALHAVAGDALTARALRGARGTVDVLAVGKAGAAMTRGALAAPGLRVRRALVVVKHGTADAALAADARVTLRGAGHPLPDAASFAAGQAVLEFVRGHAGAPPLLVLLSGGASALIEVPAPGLSRADLMRAHAWLVGSGLPIGAVNRVRQRLSAIKGGGLAAALGGRPARVLLISDVAGDAPWAIGSGPFCPPPPAPLPRLPDWLSAWARRAPPAADRGPTPPHRVIGNAALAARAAVARARALGLPARLGRGGLHGDAARAGTRLGRATVSGAPGVTVWHGETTVALCPRPGLGGRNRHLALAAACQLAGHADCALLALATDGDDHAGAAGALVDGGTLARGSALGLDAHAALRSCDSGAYLGATGDALAARQTGTNVTDLVIGCRRPS